MFPPPPPRSTQLHERDDLVKWKPLPADTDPSVKRGYDLAALLKAVMDARANADKVSGFRTLVEAIHTLNGTDDRRPAIFAPLDGRKVLFP